MSVLFYSDRWVAERPESATTNAATRHKIVWAVIENVSYSFRLWLSCF